MVSRKAKSDKQTEVIVIGAGFAGLAASCTLAEQGFKVTVLENHEQIGGRARVWRHEGFVFDMGPSWYWMPDVFEKFFARFGRKVSDYYTLKRLDPPYRMYHQYGKGNGDLSKEVQCIDMPDKVSEVKKVFEAREKGSSSHLQQFLDEADEKYRIAMGSFVQLPSLSLTEYVTVEMIRDAIMKLSMFKSTAAYVREHFKDELLVKLLEWPVLFLGGAPKDTPAMYSLIDKSAIVDGTYYPEKGMAEIALGIHRLALDLGVTFKCGSEYKVTGLIMSDENQAEATGVNFRWGEILW